MRFEPVKTPLDVNPFQADRERVVGAVEG